MSPESTSVPDEDDNLRGDEAAATGQPEAGPREGGSTSEPMRAGAASSAPAVEGGEAVVHPSLGRVILGCVLAWAFPGAGHVALGRVARGALFAAVILGLFAGGLALDGKVYRPVAGQPLSYLAALGAVGVGLPYALVHGLELGEGDLGSSGYEYGTTFTLVAGLLNLLVVLDAYDVATGRR